MGPCAIGAAWRNPFYLLIAQRPKPAAAAYAHHGMDESENPPTLKAAVLDPFGGKAAVWVTIEPVGAFCVGLVMVPWGAPLVGLLALPWGAALVGVLGAGVAGTTFKAWSSV